MTARRDDFAALLAPSRAVRSLPAAVSVCCAAALVIASPGCKKSEPAAELATAVDAGAAVPADAATGAGAGAGEAKAEEGAKAPAAGLPDANVLLEQAAKVAGETAMAGVSSVHITGKTEIVGQNIGGSSETWWTPKGFLTTQTMDGVGVSKMGMIGGTAWSQDPILGLRGLEGEELEQMRWSASPQLLAQWRDFFTDAKTTAQETFAGEQAYAVELKSGSGATVTMIIDGDDHRLLGQRFSQITPMGATPVTVTFEDVRDIEGVKIPFRQVVDLGIAKAVATLDKVEFNTAVDESTFARPGGAPVEAPGIGARDERTAEEREAAAGGMPFDADGKPGRPVPAKQ